MEIDTNIIPPVFIEGKKSLTIKFFSHKTTLTNSFMINRIATNKAIDMQIKPAMMKNIIAPDINKPFLCDIIRLLRKNNIQGFVLFQSKFRLKR